MKLNTTAPATVGTFARTWLLLPNALRRIFSTALLPAVSLSSVNAQIPRANEPPKFITLTSEWHGFKREVMDRDGDGWDDMWRIICRINHRDKTKDTDLDGVTDYEEMILNRDPNVKGPLPAAPLTPEEIARYEAQVAVQKASEKARLEREWPVKQAELAQTTRQTFDGKAADPEFVRNDDAKQKQAVAKRLADGIAAEPALERALNDIAAKYGIPRAGINVDGKGWTLIGESPSGPVYVETQNARSADTIRADDLWPAGLHSWQNTALTRNLTGNGITTSIFEAGTAPGILTTHQEFGGRATQIGTVTAGNHATAVADVIAGGGVLDVIRNSVNQGKMLRGVAYQSNIRGHGLSGFITNTANAVTAGHRFSNHSYGLPGGWDIASDGVNYYWYWHRASFIEDTRFGLYSPADATVGAGISSKEIDEFVHTTQVQLPVYAAGNPNNFGPGAPTFYYTVINNQLTWTNAERDWLNGDSGGYDTVLAPGTAKNVLTVGSILDVTSSTVYLSSFSGTGPTDDGRIKPDVVAVGQRNTALGQGSSLFLARTGSNSAYYDGVSADSGGTVDQMGTSFAAPQVQGALALAQQRRAQLFPTAGPLLASTWRALIIHTAAELGAPGPDYKYGWGIADTVRVVETLEADATLGRGALIKEFEIAQGQPKSFLVELPANTAGTWTVAWSDPAGNPPALDTLEEPYLPTAILVNNLDLTVQNLGTGTTHYPWILNPDLGNETSAARSAAATTGVDNLNNVERIDIAASSQARTFRVTVTPQGTITSGPQKVSLIITGAVPVAPAIVSFGSSGNPNNANEMAHTLKTDPGAYFTVQSSTELTTGTWSDVSGSTVLATGEQTTVLINRNPAESRRFWRLRRGQ